VESSGVERFISRVFVGIVYVGIGYVFPRVRPDLPVADIHQVKDARDREVLEKAVEKRSELAQSLSPIVLVVRGSEFVGSHIVDALLEEEMQVVVMDKHVEHENRQGWVGRLNDRLHPTVIHVAAQPGVKEDLDLLPNVPYSYVVYVPEESPRLGEEDNIDEEKRYREDVDTLKHLVDLLGERDVPLQRLTVISSLDVYGPVSTAFLPIRARMKMYPSTKWGRVMLAMENVAKESGFPYAIIRVSSLYGPRQSPTRSIIADLLSASQDGSEAVLPERSSVSRDFTFVGDLADFVFEVMYVKYSEKLEVNVATGYDVEVGALPKLVESVTGKTIRVRTERIRLSIPNQYAFREYLETRFETDVETGLKETWGSFFDFHRVRA